MSGIRVVMISPRHVLGFLISGFIFVFGVAFSALGGFGGGSSMGEKSNMYNFYIKSCLRSLNRIYLVMSSIRAFSLLEVLGVVGVVLLLAVLALPAMRNMSEGSKASVAERNAAALNSAVQQYDQLGGLMSAQVHESDPTPELAVLNLLRNAFNVNGDQTGQLVASWQEPVMARTGPRVVWINGVADLPANKPTKSASGARNINVERAIAEGTGGRFEVITAAGRSGIVGFVKGSLTGITPTLAAPTPPAAHNNVVTLTLNPPAAGTIKLNGANSPKTYAPNAVANVVVTLNPGYVPASWDAELTALLGGSTKLGGSFTVAKSITGVLTADKGDLTVSLSANPPIAGTVTGSGAYKYGDTVSYSATPAAGWAFKSWAAVPGPSPYLTTFPSPTQASGKVDNIKKNLVAVATFQRSAYIINIIAGVGGTTNLAPKKYEHVVDDKIPLDAYPTWSDSWGQPRYRWASWSIGAASEPTKAYTHVVSSSVDITPVFKPQFKFDLSQSVNPSMGDVTASLPSGIYDEGVKVTLSGTPKTSADPKKPFGFRRWELSTDAAGATWSTLLDGNSELVFTIKADSHIRAVFTDVYTLKNIVKFKNGTPAPASSVVFSVTPADQKDYVVGEEVVYTVTPAKGFVIDSINGADLVTPINSDLARSGGSVKIKMLKDTAIDIIVRYCPLVAYWNSFTGTGNIYPASTVAVSGVPFASAVNKGVVTPAQVSNWLGSVGISRSSSSTSSNSTSKKGQGSDDHHTWIYTTTTTTTVTTRGARSANVVLLDADTGALASVIPYKVQSVGQVLANVGQIVGVSYGTGGTSSSSSSTSSKSSSGKQTPIIVDLNFNGMPDLLAGPEWGKSKNRIPDSKAYRLFKMDGITDKLWEWVAGGDGLLVWNPKHLDVFDITGIDLFGEHTFGKSWGNGYEALQSLDISHDGELSSDELNDIYVWQDKNSDAKVQKDELLSTKSLGIVSIGVEPVKDDMNNASAEQSVMVEKAGQLSALSTWDWVSYGGLPEGTKLSADPFLNTISDYCLTSKGVLNNAHLSFMPTKGGLGVFLRVAPNESADIGTIFTREGEVITWDAPVVDNTGATVMTTNRLEFAKDGIKGTTTIAGMEPEEWSGSLDEGLPVTLLLDIEH